MKSTALETGELITANLQLTTASRIYSTLLSPKLSKDEYTPNLFVKIFITQSSYDLVGSSGPGVINIQKYILYKPNSLAALSKHINDIYHVDLLFVFTFLLFRLICSEKMPVTRAFCR